MAIATLLAHAWAVSWGLQQHLLPQALALPALLLLAAPAHAFLLLPEWRC
jgi:hypothetical protein